MGVIKLTGMSEEIIRRKWCYGHLNIKFEKMWSFLYTLCFLQWLFMVLFCLFLDDWEECVVLCSDSVLFGLVITLKAARFLGLGVCLCTCRTKVQCWSKDFYLHLCKQTTDPTHYFHAQIFLSSIILCHERPRPADLSLLVETLKYVICWVRGLVESLVHMTEGGREGALMQDQYVLHTAEDQQISLPFSCRHGWIPECLIWELGQDFFGVYVAEEVILQRVSSLKYRKFIALM